MALYSYKAKDKDGKIVEDIIQAATSKEVASQLKSENLQVLTIKSLDKKVGSLFRGSISVSEKAAFCRFMATMLKAGLPLPEALDIIREETQSKKLKEVLLDISFHVRKGGTLSSILSKYKSEFDSVFLTMIKAGEESGTLEKSLEYLGKELLASYELSQKVKGAMMYPAVIVVVMVGVSILMMTFVLPKLSEVFLSLNVELPVVTRFIFNFGQTIGQNLAATLGIFFSLMLTTFLLLFIRSTRQFIFSGFVKLPIVKKVMDQIDVARFARTLATLLKSGVPIISALDVSSDAISQIRLKKQAKEISKGVSEGESLYDILSSGKRFFPVTMIQTIRAGEKSGSLEVVLDEMAGFYETEIDYSLKRATSLIEPILMLVIGVAVGAMVIIMITPIYSILGGLEEGGL